MPGAPEGTYIRTHVVLDLPAARRITGQSRYAIAMVIDPIAGEVVGAAAVTASRRLASAFDLAVMRALGGRDTRTWPHTLAIDGGRDLAMGWLSDLGVGIGIVVERLGAHDGQLDETIGRFLTEADLSRRVTMTDPGKVPLEQIVDRLILPQA